MKMMRGLIHQNAWFNMGTFDKGHCEIYSIKRTENGAYLFVISGSFEVAGQQLNTRDAIGCWETDSVNLISLERGSRILIIDVPMNLA